MRVIIEGIKGKELVLLMELLRKFDFENKSELLGKYDEYVKKEVKR